MPIYSSIGIMGSVGKGGKNGLLDVQAVQKRLNELMGTSRKPLAVDGKCGPKTIGMIMDFQKNVLGFQFPDGRVDPAMRTIRALNDPASASKWQRMSLSPVPPPTPKTPAENLIEREAEKAGLGKEFDEFRREVIDKHIPTVKIFLGSIGRSDDARKVIAAWAQLRKWGFSPDEARDVMKAITGMKKHAPTMGVLDEIGKPNSGFARFLGKTGNVAGKVGIAVTLIEVADKMEQGDYLYGTTELYKHFMGKAIPWAGVVEGLQSLVEAVAPASAKNHQVFKILRSCDPIGLGATGIDAVTTLALGLVHMVRTDSIDYVRLNRLVDRMKSGPTRVFAEMGEDLGDATYEMSQWRRDDWTYAVKSVPGWVKSWFD